MLFFVIKAKRMKFLSSIFGLKTKSEDLNSVENPAPQPPVAADRLSRAAIADRARQILSYDLDMIVRPSVVGSNFIELFKTIPEVFWPIDFIAKRISEAHFDLKRVKDDSLVWCNRLGADTILKQPNPVMTWREIVYQHFVYKLATGNAFLSLIHI